MKANDLKLYDVYKSDTGFKMMYLGCAYSKSSLSGTSYTSGPGFYIQKPVPLYYFLLCPDQIYVLEALLFNKTAKEVESLEPTIISKPDYDFTIRQAVRFMPRTNDMFFTGTITEFSLEQEFIPIPQGGYNAYAISADRKQMLVFNVLGPNSFILCMTIEIMNDNVVYTLENEKSHPSYPESFMDHLKQLGWKVWKCCVGTWTYTVNTDQGETIKLQFLR